MTDFPSLTHTPRLPDCRTRADVDAYGDAVLATARAIVDGGRTTAERYADEFIRKHRWHQRFQTTELARRRSVIAQGVLEGAKAALSFGRTQIRINDHGHRLVCIPSIDEDRGRYLGYMPWIEERRLLDEKAGA